MMTPDETLALHFSESGLMENVLQDTALYNELIGMARESLLEYKPRLEAALEKTDFPTIRIIAHSIKGLALTMHCHRMKKLAQEVESHAEQNNPTLSLETVSPLLEEIELLLSHYLLPKQT